MTVRQAAAALLVVGLVGVVVVQYRRAGGHLRKREAELAAAIARLDDLRSDLGSTRNETGLVHDATARTRVAITEAVATRDWTEAVAANTFNQIAAVNAERGLLDGERWLVTLSSNEAQACFDGVAAAVRASRSHDRGAAVEALQNAAPHCARTLAQASGADFPYDFPDPSVLRVGGTYYGYSTNSGAGDIQVIRSTDLEHWELVGNALAGLPGWAAPNATWAPAVLPRDGGYVAYYTVRDRASGRQCISTAVASGPTGPFADHSAAPLVCQLDHGGSIDPSPFVAPNGRAYLLWKSEGHGAVPAAIWSQELTPDGRGLTGLPQVLMTVDRSFEHGVVEAPSMFEQGGRYYLLYSGADWSSRRYTTAYAACAGPTGPCLKPADGRVLRSGPTLAGPGGASVFRDGSGGLRVAFHAFTEPNVGYPNSRYLHVARLRVTNGGLAIDAET